KSENVTYRKSCLIYRLQKVLSLLKPYARNWSWRPPSRGCSGTAYCKLLSKSMTTAWCGTNTWLRLVSASVDGSTRSGIDKLGCLRNEGLTPMRSISFGNPTQANGKKVFSI